MHVSGVEQSVNVLQASVQRQADTKAVSQANKARQNQGKAAVASITAAADEAERSPDGDEKGGRFQTIA